MVPLVAESYRRISRTRQAIRSDFGVLGRARAVLAAAVLCTCTVELGNKLGVRAAKRFAGTAEVYRSPKIETKPQE